MPASGPSSSSGNGLLAIIGGSGLYELPGLVDTAWVAVDTPWGAPSDQILTGTLPTPTGPARLAFLPRHGRGHRLAPSDLNYRANIAALKQLGATDVLSLSAVGGLRADLPPLYNDYRFRSNISDARNIGVEAFAEVDLLRLFGKTRCPLRWTWFVNTALVDARYIHTQDASIRNKRVEMAPPLLFKSGTTLQKGAWRVAVQGGYVAAHYSDATNAERTSTAVEGKIPAYFVMDLSASWRWHSIALAQPQAMRASKRCSPISTAAR